MLSRNELAARTLKERLKTARIGVLARGLHGVDFGPVLESLVEGRARPLHVALVGVASPAEAPAGVVLATDVETGVDWRNHPELAGDILVVVEGDVEKMHSLAELDEVTPRDLTRTLLEWAQKELRLNEVQDRVWAALAEVAATLPLPMVEEFVGAVEAEREDLEAISRNLWRIALLADTRLLNRSANPADRLALNARLVMEMSQLTEASRRRIAAALRSGSADERVRTAYAAVNAFHRFGRRDALRQLDVSAVEQLIRTSRVAVVPVAPPPPPPPVPEADLDVSEIEPAPEAEEPGGESALADDALPAEWDESRTAESIGRYAVDPSPEAREALAALADKILERANQENPDEEFEVVIPGVFGGATVRPPQADKALRGLVGAACTATAWGGTLRSPQHTLRDAIERLDAEDFVAFDPNAASPSLGGRSLFELLRAMDPDLPPGANTTFAQELARFQELRTVLLEGLHALLDAPATWLAGKPEVGAALRDYIDTYRELLRVFRVSEPFLRQRNHAQAVMIAASELIRLDVIHVQVDGIWKALLTPLHPLYLWRYAQILDFAHAHGKDLDDAERAQLGEAITEPRAVLPFLALSPSVVGPTAVTLPHAGHYGDLPAYENDTNRFLGSDGVDFLQDLVRRWVADAPYTRAQVRVALVDVPDLPRALAALRKFLIGEPTTTVVCDLYFTRERDADVELGRLDFEGADHETGELIRTRRLSVATRRAGNLADVTRQLRDRPVHVAYFFDQSEYRVVPAPRTDHLTISPLVVTYEYTYDRTFRRGEIAPSTYASDGLFDNFDQLVALGTASPAGQQQRLRQAAGADLQPLNAVLREDAARWLAVADRSLIAYHPEGAVPLAEVIEGQREVGVWARDESYSVRQYRTLLLNYNLNPDLSSLAELMRRYGHVATSGRLGLPPAQHAADAAERKRRKGLIGTVLAAAWYRANYGDCLIASLDTPLARRWLHDPNVSRVRADLVGVRMDGDRLVVEPIEVKAHDKIEPFARRADPVRGAGVRLEGAAVDQLLATLRLLRPVFRAGPDDPLFTPARREVLKYQLYRECFRHVGDGEWQEEWFARLNAVFSTAPVDLRALVVHVHLEESGLDEEWTPDGAEPVALVRLGGRAVQRLIARAGGESAPDAQVSAAPEPRPTDGPDPPIARAVERTTNEITSPTATEPASTPAGGATQPVPGQPPVRHETAAPATVAAPQPPAPADSGVPESELAELARGFRRGSSAFGIKIAECDPARAVVGPNVIRYYVRLAPDQRLAELRSHIEDIGREMHRSGLLISPIPHSNQVALDVPRLSRGIVPFEDALADLPQIPSPERMPLAIGVTPEGTRIAPDLATLHHLLVGGATGKGKTMLLYSILTSLLARHPSPDHLRLFLSTNKPEDFVFFSGLPHLETGAVVSGAEEALRHLHELVSRVFDERGALLVEARCRDIGEYNRKHPDAPLPPFVLLIDELADLADELAGAAKNAFYAQLRRVAQMGRARGVHLVLCTQRPSADLLPTSIRSQMNGRVALTVNDATSSRIILEEPGAEQLQGSGDLLFKEGSTTVRGQGYFVATEALDAFVAGLGLPEKV
jgi:FtsK/SpoIIIE family/FtsK alpha domain